MLRQFANGLLFLLFAGIIGIQPAGSRMLLAQDDLFGGTGGGKSVAEKRGGEPAKAKAPAKLVEKSPAENIDDIHRALDETTQLNMQEAPFADVIDYLKDYHKGRGHAGLEIVLDTKTLSDLGITPETPITKQLKGMSLRSALRLLLRDLNLTYVIRHEALVITSPAEACYTKVYDVADLISAKEGEKNSALDALVNMIAKTCPASPPSGQSGWPGWVAAIRSADLAAVVVHQPDDVQDQVAELLAQLRDVKHK
jgi:hypothetical protein